MDEPYPVLIERMFTKFNELMTLGDSASVKSTQLILLKTFPSLISVLYDCEDFDSAQLQSFVLCFSNSIRHRDVKLDAQRLLFIGSILQTAIVPERVDDQGTRTSYQLDVASHAVTWLLEWADGVWETDKIASKLKSRMFSPTVILCTQSRVNFRLWIAVIGDFVNRVHRMDSLSETRGVMMSGIAKFMPRMLVVFEEIGSSCQVLQRDRYLPKNTGMTGGLSNC